MIAIPNMSKPKFCEDCFVPLSKCEYFAKNGIDHCPLIEIDDEIWEALKPKVETMSLAERGWITDDSNT